MIVEPKVRGFICTTAHPAGCRENVKRQIKYVQNAGKTDGPKRVLVIGSSTGYGLASRIAATYACDAKTIGVMFEKEAVAVKNRTATPGWYNTKAFEEIALTDGYYAKSVNGDAFSNDIKAETISLIKEDLGQVDMVIYSLASPRRTAPDGITYTSTLKTIDCDFTNKSLNLRNNEVGEATIHPANEEEISSTIKVMGGEDWLLWIDALKKADVMAEHAVTIAYSYIGPELTYPVYYNGTIGMAKKHLYDTSIAIEQKYPDTKAYISVNKALVTQSSAAIPIVPLYIAIMYKVMKMENVHEGCIEQMTRMFHEKLSDNIAVDEMNRIRLDDWEMRSDIQSKIMEYWDQVNTDNLHEMADIDGYWVDFYHMFGFKFNNVNYKADVEV